MTDGSAATGGDRDTGAGVDVDEVLNLLSDRYRRHALACLDGQPTPIALERLTDQVAGREFQQPPETVSMVDRTEIATMLHHSHLPRLDGIGVVTYDVDEGKVTDVSIPPVLERFLDAVRRHEG